MDARSPDILAATAAGKHFAEATLDVLDANGAVVATYTLQDVIFLDVAQGGRACGTLPQEAIGLAYQKVVFETP
jgi:type VI protein secretion system component Hcp